MFQRIILILSAIVIVWLASLAFRYPAHTAIIATMLYDMANPAAGADIKAIGVDPEQIDVSDASKSHVRQALLKKHPVGTDFEKARKEFLLAGFTCELNSFTLPDDHFKTKLEDDNKGNVYRCSGDVGGSRVVYCILSFDVQTDANNRITDYKGFYGCTGP